MKVQRNIFKLLIISMIIILPSCSRVEDDTFDEPASARTKEAMSALQANLTSSQDGWLLNYYPNDDKYGAYNFLMKFDDANVIMRGDDFFKPGNHESQYMVTAAQGPVLSFSTYNILHDLADPEKYSWGKGLDGDYEFVWKRTSENKDTIHFYGRTMEEKITLTRFTGDWEEYFNTLTGNYNAFVAGTNDAMNRYFKQILLPNGTELIIGGFHPTYRNCRVIYKTAADTLAIASNSVSFNQNGFSLCNPLDVNGTQVADFVCNPDNQQYVLKGETNGMVMKGIDEPATFEFKNSAGLVFDQNYYYAFQSFGYELLPIIEEINQIIYYKAKELRKNDSFYGAILRQSSRSTKFALEFLYYKDDEPLYKLQTAVSILLDHFPNATRSDKVKIAAIANPVSSAGDYGKLIEDQCRDFYNKVTNGPLPRGYEYIIIPDQTGIYLTFASCKSNLNFTVRKIQYN